MTKLPNIITLQVLLHYYVRPVTWESVHGYARSSHDAETWLVEKDMITWHGEWDSWRVTARGAAFVEYLKDVPIPEKREIWEIKHVT